MSYGELPLVNMNVTEGLHQVELNTLEFGPAKADFSTVLTQGLSEVNESLQAADAIFKAVALNEPVSTHEVMLIMEKAKMDLRLTVEVRNKLLESYQEVMRMQV
jgi:flagellar hook-basal body complex protein FliE